MTTARPRIYFKKLQADFLVMFGNEYEKLTDQRLKKFGAAVRKCDGACFESIGHLYFGKAGKLHTSSLQCTAIFALILSFSTIG